MEDGKEAPRRFYMSALTEDENARLESAAEEQGIPVGMLLRQIVRAWLKGRYAAAPTKAVTIR